MIYFNPTSLGITLLLLGFSFFAFTWFALRATRTRPGIYSNNHALTNSVQLEPHTDGFLLIHSGGRILHSNLDNLDWCNFSAEEIDLNHLLHRFRPSEVFLNLCTTQGRAHLAIGDISIEGISFKVPYGSDNAMMVCFKRIEELTDDPEKTLRISRNKNEKSPTRNTIEIFAEISKAIISGSNLEETLIAVLAGVGRLVPADFCEVLLIENESQIVAYRLQDFSGETCRLLKNDFDPSQIFSNYVFSNKTCILISDIDEENNFPFEVQRFELPIHSYLGTPLIFSDEFLGAIELGSLSAHSLNQKDLELLDLLAGHISTAIKKALAFKRERQRSDELDGIANIFNSINGLQDPEELFTRLVESLAPLLDVDILGFLLYDDEQRLLKGQAPFRGIPHDFVTQYFFKISKDSAADDLIQSNEKILTSNAVDDARIIILKLDDLAIASGMRHTILLPLKRNQRFLGYLLIANHQNKSVLSIENQQLIESISIQVTPIIENLSLFQRSHLRIQRVEALSLIANLTSSQASLDGILKQSLAELAKLLHADMAAIYLLDKSEQNLWLHELSAIGIPSQTREPLINLKIDQPEFRLTVTKSQRPFLSWDVNQDSRILSVYEPILTNLNISSAIDVPLIIGDRGIGEILFGCSVPDRFTQADLDTLETAANQLAGAIERSWLASQTDEGLRKRINQLAAVTQISQELNSTLDLRFLIQKIYSEALRTTSANGGTILLFRPDESSIASPQVAYYFGEKPSDIYSDKETFVIKNRKPLVFSPSKPKSNLLPTFHSWDEEQDASFPLDVKSFMIIPITFQDQVIGLMELHSQNTNHFDETTQDIAISLANQAAIALGNAQQYEELIRQNSLLNRRIDLLAKVIETNQSLKPDLPLERSLNTIASGIQESTNFNIVLISIIEQQSQNLIRTSYAGLPQELIIQLQANSQPWKSVKTLLQEEFRLGNAYFIPYEKMPVMPVDIHSVVPISLDFIPTEPDDWHPEDVFIYPLYKPDGQPLGLISLDDPRDGKRPDRSTLESLEIFASQAAFLIEVHQQINFLQDQNMVLENDLGLLEKYKKSSFDNFAELEQKQTEQSDAIQELDRIGLRLRIALDIADLVSQQDDQPAILRVVGEAFQERIGFNLIIVAENAHEGLRIIHRQGSLPENTIIESLLGQLNPLNDCFSSNEMLIVPDIERSKRWDQSHFLKTLNIKNFLAIPIQTEGKTELVFLAAGNSSNSRISLDDAEFYQTISRQIATAIKKLHLVSDSQRRVQEINLLLEFTRQIESLDPNHLLQALIDSTENVVNSAQAGFIAQWQPDRNALIPIASAGFSNPESILKIELPLDGTLPGRVYQQKKSIRIGEVDFARDYPLTSDSLLCYQDSTGGKLPVSSLIVPIFVSKFLPDSQEISPYEGVLVLDNYTTPSGFSKEDQAIATSLAQQAALTLANYGLFHDAEQRASQLKALTRVSTAITSSLQRIPLLSTLLDQLKSVVPYDTGTLWIRDQQTLLVQSARGFDDEDNRLGLTVNVDDSDLFREMLEFGHFIYIGDIRFDPRFAGLVETHYHTWIGLPLSLQGNVIGVIALEKSEPNFYKDQDLELLMTFASQAATAIENAQLYEESIRQNQELDKNSRRATLLSQLSFKLNSTLEIAEIFSLSSQHLTEAIHCSGISIISLEEKLRVTETGSLGASSTPKAMVVDEYPRKTVELPIHLPDLPLFIHLAQTTGIFSTDDSSQEPTLQLIQNYLGNLDARSLIILPMVTGHDLHSLWMIYSHQAHHFLQDEIDLARMVVNQTAISYEKARLFKEIRGLTQDLEKRVEERTSELANEHQRTQTLLRLSTELSATLDIGYIIERTLTILKETTDATHISCLVWRPGEENLRHAASIGYSGIAPMKGKPMALRKDQGLIGWIIANRKAAIIQDVLEDSRWIQLPDTKLLHRSAIALPLIVGEELLGAIFLFHPDVNHFSEDKLDLVQAAANQVAVAINNAELYNLIREQADELSGLLRQQKVETSQSRAILEAVAEGVLVTDASGYVMLFNDSAEKILQLHRDQVLGGSIDDFTGLFGSVGKTWIETIRHWAQEPSSFNPGVYYADQINLDNGQIVSVNLAPVLFQNEFLGTVSIFHDVTHQIVVDRLKSEFVATVSHELRTPMTSIKGYVEVLLMGAAGPLNQQQARFLGIVKNNTERLAVLVNDLLDLSRIEAGKVILAFQPIDLHSLVEGAITEFRQRSIEDNKPMQFSTTIPPELPRVIGDPERVRQIIMNLLENAYDYTPIHGHIKLRASQSNGDIQVDIIDNGIGIPLTEQARVFDRFYRGEDPLVLASSGTGLGLNIVQQLVNMHHGRIWLTSTGKPGEGSSFSFTLPAYPQQVEQRSEAVLWQRS